jgi:cell division protease FtsH
MRFGMSDSLGPRVFGGNGGQPFLGRQLALAPDYSADTAAGIDDEIRRILKEAHRRATRILLEHRASLTSIAEILVRCETLERDQFTALLAGQRERELCA